MYEYELWEFWKPRENIVVYNKWSVIHETGSY